MKNLLIIGAVLLGLTAFVFMNAHDNVDYAQQAEFDYRYQN